MSLRDRVSRDLNGQRAPEDTNPLESYEHAGQLVVYHPTDETHQRIVADLTACIPLEAAR